MTNERITLKTTDDVTIIGDFALPSNAAQAVLLLHMMPATRESWAPLSEALNKAGFATLAIDLRGHGESTRRLAQGDTNNASGKKLDYKKFTDRDHQASRLDVDAAMNFLKGKGFNGEHIALVGASIGANLSIDAMQRYNNVKKAAALSPGLDYRGVLTEPAVKGLGAQQKIWLAAAKLDEYSAQSCETLYKLRPTNSKLTIFEGREHGTDLFASQPGLIADIVKFLQ